MYLHSLVQLFFLSVSEFANYHHFPNCISSFRNRPIKDYSATLRHTQYFQKKNT